MKLKNQIKDKKFCAVRREWHRRHFRSEMKKNEKKKKKLNCHRRFGWEWNLVEAKGKSRRES